VICQKLDKQTDISKELLSNYRHWLISKTKRYHLLQETEEVVAFGPRLFSPEHAYPAARGVKDLNIAGDEAAGAMSVTSDIECGDQDMSCGTPTSAFHVDPNSAQDVPSEVHNEAISFLIVWPNSVNL